MKPRTILAETTLPDGGILQLQEHDGRHQLVVAGQQIAGPSTRAAEEELARLAAAPFRPARQPKVWLCGLGIGQTLDAITPILQQKRAMFVVAEPLPEVVAWHRRHFPNGSFGNDPRVSWEDEPGPSGLQRHAGSLNAVLIHIDAAPLSPKHRPWTEERSWLAAAYEALQEGGLLAVAASRQVPAMSRRLQRAGFDVAEFMVPAAANAKKPRLQPIWLARKGKPEA
jgi:spermidine synthase